MKNLLALCLAMIAGFAQAALPTEAAAAFTSMSGNITDILAVLWPMVITVTGGYFLIRHFKKGTSKV